MLLGEAAKRLGLTANQVKSTTTTMENEKITFEREEHGFRIYTDDHLKEIAKRRGIVYPLKPVKRDAVELLVDNLTEDKRKELLIQYIRESITA